MKHSILSLACAFLISTSAFAQLADGSTVPDFTANDINGNSHSLYADYLDQGMPVIIDVSATWCGPCWSFHNGHALKDLYMVYGPGGSNEIGVLFIEGDGNTGLAELQGTGNTQGNWIEGTPYPIIDNANVAQVLQTPYYPIVYGVCPDKSVYEFGQGNAAQLKNKFIQFCSSSLEGATDNVTVDNFDAFVCMEGDDVTPSISVTNHGTNNVTSLDLNVFENGNNDPIETIEWTGNIGSLASTSIDLSTITNVSSSQYYTVIASNPNQNTDEYDWDAYNAANISLNMANSTNETEVVITIFTDNYPGETSWEFLDGSGTVLASGGPYTGNGQSSGGADALQAFEYNVTLDGDVDCYELKIDDSYGDGLSLGNESGYGIETVGGISLVNEFQNPNFGSSVTAFFSTAESAPSFNCVNNSCVDPGDGSGTYATVEDCQSSCAITTYDCINGGCVESSNSSGAFISLQLCETNCSSAPSPSNIDDNLIVPSASVNVYPNPIQDIATVEFQLENNAELNLSIMNILGQVVYTELVKATSGKNKMSVDLSNLKDGVYLVQMNINNETITKKITLSK